MKRDAWVKCCLFIVKRQHFTQASLFIFRRRMDIMALVSIQLTAAYCFLLFLSCFIQWVAIITSCWIDQKFLFQTHYYAWSPLFLPYLPCLLLWVAIIPSFLNWPENLQWIHKTFIWPQWANEPKSHYYYGIPLLKKFQIWSFKPNL